MSKNDITVLLVEDELTLAMIIKDGKSIHTETMTKTDGKCPTVVPCLGRRIISGEHSN